MSNLDSGAEPQRPDDHSIIPPQPSSSALPDPPQAGGRSSRSFETDSRFDTPGTGLIEEPEDEDNEVHFVFSAEFDIDLGATLTHQYPYPTGAKEQRVAELMLPDGAHDRQEDWTVFYLGQKADSAIEPILDSQAAAALPGSAAARPRGIAEEETDEEDEEEGEGRGGNAEGGGGDEMGRTVMRRKKKRKTKGGLLYVISCVRTKADSTARRGATVRALAVCSPNPHIQIYKPIIVLALEETFLHTGPEVLQRIYDSLNSITKNGLPNFTRMEKILLRQTDRKDLFAERFAIEGKGGMDGSGLEEMFEEADEMSSISSHQQQQPANYRSSISSKTSRPFERRKLSTSSSLIQRTPSIREGVFTPDVPVNNAPKRKRAGAQRDTHFFDTEVTYGNATLPMKIPTTLFPEEVGDYSLVELVNAFQHSNPFPAPYIPYLHTNGVHTHPLIVILNAILTQKRVCFISHSQGSHVTARMVLAACAMATGCGQVLRGVTAHTYPTAGLWDVEDLESSPAYVAGVTNPRFEALTRSWDVLCEIDTGKVTVSPHYREGPPPTVKNDAGRSKSSLGSGAHDEPGSTAAATTITAEMERPPPSRADCTDNAFMEDVLQAVQFKYGESLIRQRFIDYMIRFVSLAAYHEYDRMGSTNIGYPTVPYQREGVGSGAVFADDAARTREMFSNERRIDAWRKTPGYQIAAKDWQKTYRIRPIKFDIAHQIWKLHTAKSLSDSETEQIFLTIARGVRTYDQVVELLSHLPHHRGGLATLGHGLHHRWPGVSENATDIFLNMQEYAIGRQAVANMNYFHRKTLLRMLERRANEAAYREQMVHVEQYSPDSGSFSPSTVNGSSAYHG